MRSVLISTSSFNACSCNSGGIHVIVTVSLNHLVICHSLSKTHTAVVIDDELGGVLFELLS